MTKLTVVRFQLLSTIDQARIRLADLGLLLQLVIQILDSAHGREAVEVDGTVVELDENVVERFAWVRG